MRIILAVAGLILVVLTVVDVLQTTLAKGGGFLTNRLGRRTWRLLDKQQAHSRSSWMLAQGGLLVMLVIIAVWVLLVWLGWTLVFNAAPTAVLNATTQVPATFLERAYFAGWTLVTLGLGDFQPEGSLWQIATVLAAFNGLFIVTFSITYLVPVLQAAIDRRSLAIYINGLGNSAEEIVRNAWHDGTCRGLDQHLAALAPAIGQMAQRHLTYPVLHYFDSKSRTEAFAPNVAALDEALTIIEEGLARECMAPISFLPARRAIDELLKTLDADFLDPASEPPPAPDLDLLRLEGISCCEDVVFRDALTDVQHRRQLLRALVQSEGWTWDDVHMNSQNADASDTK